MPPLQSAGQQIKELEDKRALIDDERIRDLTDKLDRLNRQMADFLGDQGELRARTEVLRDQAEEQFRRLEEAEKVRQDLRSAEAEAPGSPGPAHPDPGNTRHLEVRLRSTGLRPDERVVHEDRRLRSGIRGRGLQRRAHRP